MKLFKDYITERKQVGTLYHYTDLKKAISIIKDGAFKSGNRFKYISFTRDKNLHKRRDFKNSDGTTSGASFDVGNMGITVRFVVNGDKLSDKYKVRPFNYFQKKHGANNPFYDEMEERVGDNTKKVVIENIHKYVIRVDLNKKAIDLYDPMGNEENLEDMNLNMLDSNMKNYVALLKEIQKRYYKIGYIK